MMEIDNYSYQCGIMDCFNEMVKAGLKPMALAHPFKTKIEREVFIPFAKEITTRYHTFYYLDDDPLITDLFAYSLNRDTFNIIFYQKEETIEQYKKLKIQKNKALTEHNYNTVRQELAYQFGHLLGYPNNMIADYIKNNNEKEIIL